MSEGSTASAPITKGGFANDGSDVFSANSAMAETLSTLLEKQNTSANSSTPHSSGFDFDDYYDISGVCSFILTHELKCVAMQFPDEQLVHTTKILTRIKELVNTKTDRKVEFYVLGDTSYSSCCVDFIAASHVNADGLIHFGFACMTPTRGIPVYYVHGSKRFDIERTVLTLSSPDTFRDVFPSLDESLITAPGQLPIANVFILYDRLFAHGVRKIVSYLQSRGVFASLNSHNLVEQTALVNEEKTIEENRPHHVRLVFGYIDNSEEQQSDTAKNVQNGEDVINLGFAGFHLKVTKSCLKLREVENIEDYDDESESYDDTEDDPLSLTLLKDRRKILSQKRTSFFVLSSLLNEDEEAAKFANQQPVTLRAPLATQMSDGFTSPLLERSSAALIIHSVMNFSGYNVASVNIPSCETGGSDMLKGRPFYCTVYSGQKRFTQLLGRRYYQIAKAKDCSVFGIVASALSSSHQVAIIRRLEYLAKAYGKKTYVLSIGKLNEPKLLNFPDIEAFVLVSCPFTSLIETPYGWAPNVISAVEFELALTGADWTGDYTTDPSTVVSEEQAAVHVNVERENNGVLLIDREEGPSMLALDDEEGENMEEITADLNIQAKNSDDKVVSAKLKSRITSKADEPTEAEKELGFVNDTQAPRFSLIDQRLHVNATRELVREISESQSTESKLLIEKVGSSSGALIEDISFKPQTKSFTGLDPSVENLPEGAFSIQKGLHGIARSYVVKGEEYSHPTVRLPETNTCSLQK